MNIFKKIRWKYLKPGQVIVDDIRINDETIPELSSFPVLTHELLNLIHGKYRLNPDRVVTVVESSFLDEYSGSDFNVRELAQKTQEVNSARGQLLEKKTELFRLAGLAHNPDVPLISTSLIKKEGLLQNFFNSITDPVKNAMTSIPSFFRGLRGKVTLEDMINSRVGSVLKLPHDMDVTLHLVLDYSASMESENRLILAMGAITGFLDFVKKNLNRTNVRLYAFSDSCTEMTIAIDPDAVARNDTNYASFMNLVMVNRNPAAYNKVILFSDGVPTDMEETLLLTDRFRDEKIDYTQIIFRVDRERYRTIYVGEDTDSMKDNLVFDADPAFIKKLSSKEGDRRYLDIINNFTRVAKKCGGNQIILNMNEATPPLLLECYDRYLGILSMNKSGAVH